MATHHQNEGCAQLCQNLCNPMDCSPPGSSVPGIFQARILEQVAMSSSRLSSQLRDQTHISCLLHWQAGSLPLVQCGKQPKRRSTSNLVLERVCISLVRSAWYLYQLTNRLVFCEWEVQINKGHWKQSSKLWQAVDVCGPTALVTLWATSLWNGWLSQLKPLVRRDSHHPRVPPVVLSMIVTWKWNIQECIYHDLSDTSVSHERELQLSLWEKLYPLILTPEGKCWLTGFSVHRGSLKWSEVKLLSHVQLFVTPWTVAYQAPLSMRFSRQ